MDEAAFRELISGAKRGAGASLSRVTLGGLSCFYGWAVALRNRAYDLGLKRIQRPAVPVVSVGNITTGGTGKTPFVSYVANWFSRRDVPVVLLSRGYRALPDAVNDEKLVLDQLCPGVPHLQNPDRVASSRQAVTELGAKLLILDDGFQHRRLGRDLDIVLIDATNPWGYGRLLPRGLLREPIHALTRASLIVITRVDQCEEKNRESILRQIRLVCPKTDCVEVAYPPTGLLNASGESCELDKLHGQPVLAFCGIGNPDGFLNTVTDSGMQVAELRAFPDHHHHTEEDLADLAQLAEEQGASVLVTTQKDLVKINRNALGDFPLWAVQIGVQVIRNEELLITRLSEIAERV